MKRLIIILFIGLLIACNEANQFNFFPGTYVRSSENEFGKEYDTLVISELNGEYQIHRKWKYERTLDGEAKEPEYKQRITTAYYDDKYRILHENETGNRMSVDSHQGLLFIGPTKYKMLK